MLAFLFSILLLLFTVTNQQGIRNVHAIQSLPISGPISEPKYSILEYKFPWPPYQLKAPWQSGMAQAQALGILARAYNITHDIKYLNTSKMLLNSFFVEVKDGGVTYKTPTNGWWYELYAGDNTGAKQPRVLNGMMFTLVGLYDYYNHTKNITAKYLFDKGMVALASYLPFYDNNGSTYYDILKTPGKTIYHLANIRLLSQLYQITGQQYLKVYHDRWKAFNINKLAHQPPTDIILDNSSIPLVNYRTIDGIKIGLQRNPVTVDHVALDYFQHYERYGDNDSKQAFLNNANWILNNSKPKL